MTRAESSDSLVLLFSSRLERIGRDRRRYELPLPPGLLPLDERQHHGSHRENIDRRFRWIWPRPRPWPRAAPLLGVRPVLHERRRPSRGIDRAGTPPVDLPDLQPRMAPLLHRRPRPARLVTQRTTEPQQAQPSSSLTGLSSDVADHDRHASLKCLRSPVGYCVTPPLPATPPSDVAPAAAEARRQAARRERPSAVS